MGKKICAENSTSREDAPPNASGKGTLPYKPLTLATTVFPEHPQLRNLAILPKK